MERPAAARRCSRSFGHRDIGLTALGFHLTGPDAKAFLVGETLYAAVILAAALCILPRRLPPVAATVATIYVVLSILAPTSPGDPIETYSFAMSYNRFGWSTLTLLFVVVFLAPRSENRSWLDQAAVLLLGTLLFYLKITYFGVGIAAIAAALALSPHVRRQSGAWLGVLTTLVIVAAAPSNVPYWSDILAALESGAAQFDILTQMRNVVTQRDTAIIAVELVCLLWLRRVGVSTNRSWSVPYSLSDAARSFSRRTGMGRHFPLFCRCFCCCSTAFAWLSKIPVFRRGSPAARRRTRPAQHRRRVNGSQPCRLLP